MLLRINNARKLRLVEKAKFRWVKLNNYCIHPYYPGEVKKIDAEYEFKTPYGEVIVATNNDIVKVDNGYIIIRARVHGEFIRALPIHIINASIDKFGRVKPRKNTTAATDEEKLFNTVEKHNLKMKLVHMGQLDIYNGKITLNYIYSDVKTVVVPNFVEMLDPRIFSRAKYSDLTRIKIQDGIKSIPSGFIAGCLSLEGIELPDTVTSIKPRGLAYSGLKEIVLPSNLSKAAESAFASNTKLTKIKFSGPLKYIGAYAFMNCTSLKRLVLPSGLGYLPAGLIAGCSHLKELYIPQSVKNIDINFFNGCCGNRQMSLLVKAPEKLREQIETAIDKSDKKDRAYTRYSPSFSSRLVGLGNDGNYSNLIIVEYY